MEKNIFTEYMFIKIYFHKYIFWPFLYILKISYTTGLFNALF